jgi:ParB family chromosome partitioning protein
MNDEVIMIPIAEIHVLNPRQRDKKKFELIVQSIKNLGLKMPIQVSLRAENEPAGLKYDLVCGQGRMEAYIALGHKEIPAFMVEISKEERLIRSLVENIARRYPSPMDLIREIERLRGQGYSNQQIGVKLDVSGSTVNGMMALRKAGEERLLHAALAGKIPLWVAVEIAKADTAEMQRELMKAFESKELNYLDIRKAKRLMQKRRLLGKQKGDGPRSSKTSSEKIVATYRQETQRQKLMIKKSRVCDARLSFVVTAFNKLLADAHFLTLLRAEALETMPKFLWTKLTPPNPETT